MSDTLQFRPPYSVAGEPGRALSSARVSLEAINAEDATIRWASQEADVMNWTQRDGIVADWGQQIAIYDATGVRVFAGYVTSRKGRWTPSGTVWTMEAQNAWYFMERVQLSGDEASADGTTQERPSYVFPRAQLQVSMTTLLTRMIELGVPIEIGDVATCFEFPQMSFSNQSLARTLVDMLNIIPDAGTHFDYQAPGLPVLRIIRRATAAVVMLDLGTDADATEKLELEARNELVANTVTVQTAALDTIGGIVLTEETATVPIPPAGIFGRLSNQLVAMAGPGRNGWTTPKIDKVSVKTAAFNTNALLETLFKTLHPGLKNVQATLSPAVGFQMVTSTITVSSSTGNGFTLTSIAPQTSYFIGEATAAGGTQKGSAVIKGTLPDWWEETGRSRQRVRYVSRFYCTCPYNDSANIQLLGTISSFQLYYGGGSMILFIADLEIEFDDIDIPYAAETTVIRPKDLDYVTPSAGLAANLLEAQAWTPFDGSATLGPEAQVIPLPATVLSARGGDPQWRTARAMVQATSLAMRTGKASITLGAPPRSNPSSLVTRFNRSATGPVVELR